VERTLLKQFLSFPLSLTFAVLSLTSGIFAQGDNPHVDALPLEWIQNINYSDAGEDVITVNGFDDFNLGVNFAEPHVSQNPLNPLEYFGAYNTNGAWRTGDGHNWTGSTPPFPGFLMRGDPVTAYDAGGRLYYENMFGSSIQGCKVIYSDNNGQTWSSPVTSISGIDKNWIAADQTSGPYSNYVYTTMTVNSGHSFARSTNRGASWSPTFTANVSWLPGAMVCVGPNGATDGGAVYMVSNNGSTFSPTYSFYLSTNGGASFTFRSSQSFAGYVGTNVNGRHSVQNMRTRPYPFIAADQSNGIYRGRLYCVYASNDPPGNGNKPDIFCRYSTNMGTTWSSPVKINDDASTQNHNQWHPSIWCDTQTGRLFVKWMDTRDTPTSDSAYIYASYSDNGGVTWAPNQRMSNQKMRINCTTCGGGGTPRYQGDYDAIVSLNNQALAMWTDFRAGSFGSYVGYFPDYAFLVSPSIVSVVSNGDSGFVTLDVPAVKLYSSTVTFSATVTPNPGANLTIDYPQGSVLTTFPGTKVMRIRTTGTVTPGTYTINIQSQGPNGTPVHRRTVQLDVLIPVELTSFSGITEKNDVILSWSTATEVNNQGFEIQRKTNGEYERIGFIEGNGTTSELQNYTFRDKNVNAGSYYYRLKQMDFDGTFEYSGEITVEVSQPADYFLSQNYPNPFNPSTTISYAIAEDIDVFLKVFDVLGNEVATLVNENQPAGTYDVSFNAGDLSSGVYYYTLQAGEFISTKKLMLMK
jgi:hypothetical protein